MQRHYKHIALATLLTGVLSGCGGEPEWVSVYEDCKQQMSAASEEMKANQDEAVKDNPQAQAMINAMGSMAMSMGMAACESVKQICEPDPDGSACQAMVQEYKKNKE